MTSGIRSGPPSETPRQVRLAGRVLVLAGAVILAWPLRSESWTAVLLPALSPYVALASALATRSVGLLALVAVPVLLSVLASPRWFCRHGCPVGLLQEGVEKLRPSAPKRWRRFPLIGRWLVLVTLGGACLGYPLFLWLDPLALLNGFLNAWRQPLTLTFLLTGLGLPMLLLLDLALPQLWCQRLCPLGATQELLVLPRRPLPATERCEITGTTRWPRASMPILPRRGFLTTCLGAATAFVVMNLRGRSAPPLRPPGSIDERSFTGVCIRCGNCARACLSRIIVPDLRDHRVAGLLTPRLRFDEDYCHEHCHRCNQVCPSGAIARLTLAEKRTRVIGPARVDLDTCLLANGRECTACIRRCPYEAIGLQSTADGFSTQPGVDLAKCTGCGACEVVCPVRPRRSIRVLPGPGILSERTPSA